MTHRPEPPIDLCQLRADDEALDRASRGALNSDDPLLRMIQTWGRVCQRGTPHPTRPLDPRHYTPRVVW